MASRCNATAAPRRRRRPAGLMHYAEKRWDALDMMASVSNRTAMGGVLRLGVAKPSSQLAVATLQETHQTYRTVAENRVDITSNLRAPPAGGKSNAPSYGTAVALHQPQPGVGDYPIGFVASPALKLGHDLFTVGDMANSVHHFRAPPQHTNSALAINRPIAGDPAASQASLATRST